MPDDIALLRGYAEGRDEAAFTELVRRRLDAVYSVALRRAGGDAHLAKDIVQQVFVALARDARRLSDHPVLIGWLYHTTRHIAANTVRSERRRKHREQEAQAMEETLARDPSEADWNQLAPVLEDAIDELGEHDRIAVLLRFIEQRSFGEIGAALRLTEDAARKRVERALDKLRETLSRRGVVSTASALAGVLTHSAVSAAPAGLAASVTSTALGGAGVVLGAITFMSVTKLQVGIAAALLVGGGIGLVSQYRTIVALRESSAGLREQLAGRAGKKESLAPASAGADARVQLVAFKLARAGANRPVVNGAAPTAGVGGDAPVAAARPAADSDVLQAKIDKLRRRYDAFFAQRGLTPAQVDRLVVLMLQQDDAREDLQASVREVGLNGDASGVEELRSKLYAPITREIREILGKEGYAAYARYQSSSYYRAAFVEPMGAMFDAANAGLSVAQTEQLVAVVAANDRPQRMKPTDIGSQSRIDWDAVLSQANALLTPAQQAVLESYAKRRKERSGSP